MQLSPLQSHVQAAEEELTRVRRELAEAQHMLQTDGRLRAAEADLQAANRDRQAVQAKAHALEGDLSRLAAELERERRLRRDMEATLQQTRERQRGVAWGGRARGTGTCLLYTSPSPRDS